MKTKQIDNESDLKHLRDQTLAYNKKWEANGKPLAIYQCPCCFGNNQTPMPTQILVDKRGYWDSVTTCYNCGEMYFIVKYPVDLLNPYMSGKILCKTLNDL